MSKFEAVFFFIRERERSPEKLLASGPVATAGIKRQVRLIRVSGAY